MYLLKSTNIFDEIRKCICWKWQICLFIMTNIFFSISSWYDEPCLNTCTCHPHFKFQNVFVEIDKCICWNQKMYLLKLKNSFVYNDKYICLYLEPVKWALSQHVFLSSLTSNYKMYLLKLTNVFVETGKCICWNWQMYLLKLENVFVWIGKCICSNFKMYL